MRTRIRLDDCDCRAHSNLMTQTNTESLMSSLLAAETDGERDRDARRVLSAERQEVQVRIGRLAEARARLRNAERSPYSMSDDYAARILVSRREVSEAAAAVEERAAEARRVAEMWGAL